MDKTCIVCGRGGKIVRERCHSHYVAALASGELALLPRRSVEERFFSKVQELPNGCWEWLGARLKGYGVFSENRHPFYAHRWAYERWVGPIPSGLHMDHFACDRPSCVNPAHVRPVTPRENILRGASIQAKNLAKTHCIHGHAFDTLNTYVTKDGKRMCRTCIRERMRRYRQEAKQL